MLEALLIVSIACLTFVWMVRMNSKRRHALESSYDPAEGERYAHKWGYDDTRFYFEDHKSVKVSGSRYPISGTTMPSLILFVEEILGVSIQPDEKNVEIDAVEIPAPVVHSTFLESVQIHFSQEQYSLDDKDRLIHSHGQLSVNEVYRIIYGTPLKRVVDLVFYPQEEDEVKTIIKLATEHNVCLVPYGGGTNVSGALSLPEDERRMIVSVDMRRMNRILWIDVENNLACIEAGISGKKLENELFEIGYTTGHEPDSIEFSTLGGWIATNASGMKKNRYGNIEDIVLEATLLTPIGEIEMKQVTPRNSIGLQPRSFLFGSEGNLGIITKAVLKIHPQPAIRKYSSLVFPSFEQGVRFLKDLRQNGALPASIRLVCNNEFRLGQALKPKPSFWKAGVDRFQKFFLFKIMKFDPKEMVACVITTEGSKAEVRQQEKAIRSSSRKHKGVSGGASNGKRGYRLTFAIAYIRDFFNQYHVLGETFETSVPWNRIHPLCQNVKKELNEKCAFYHVPGKPFLSFRVTQTYHTGVCVYFTMGLYAKGLDKPDEVFSKIERHLRQIILDNGGSLSHHHGVGKIRQCFLPQIQSNNSIRFLQSCKKAIDTKNIFGIRNGAFDPGLSFMV